MKSASLQKKEEALNNNKTSNIDTLEDNNEDETEEITPGGDEVSKESGNIKNGESLTVKISGDTMERNVEVKEVLKDVVKQMKNTEPLRKSDISELEKKVVSGRNTLSTSLFKLSAYMSQLQKETIGVESALMYAEELRRQLKETEDLVKLREGRVENLRKGIKDQHEQIIKERDDMMKMEEGCKAAGITVPEEGAENIQKKLAQIKNTAMKVKTTVYNDVRESCNEIINGQTNKVNSVLSVSSKTPTTNTAVTKMNQTAPVKTVLAPVQVKPVLNQSPFKLTRGANTSKPTLTKTTVTVSAKVAPCPVKVAPLQATVTSSPTKVASLQTKVSMSPVKVSPPQAKVAPFQTKVSPLSSKVSPLQAKTLVNVAPVTAKLAQPVSKGISTKITTSNKTVPQEPITTTLIAPEKSTTTKSNKTASSPADNVSGKNDQDSVMTSVSDQVGSAGCSGSDYSSPLAHLRKNGEHALDPNHQLCRFELSGKCLDSGCPDQHTH